jgi:hypothetical protein
MTPEELDNIINDPNTWCVTEFNNTAKLNAAAPELLQALQFALKRLEVAQMEQRYDHKTFDSHDHDLAIDMARAAIAKAINLKA